MKGCNNILELNKIYNEDCLKGMSKIPNESIDLIVTSPPYNAGKKYENKLSVQEYKDFAKQWTEQTIRILKPNGSLWINLGYMKMGENETLPLTYLYYDVINIPLIQEIVWHYEGGMSYKKRFTHRTERWQWYSKNPNNVVFNLDDIRDMSLNKTQDKRNNPLGKNPTDYWYFDRVVSGTGKVIDKTNHPCQFPIEMINRIIKACSSLGNIVLDPFIGSGTTAISCKQLDRNYIGFEWCPTIPHDYYYQTAKERIEKFGL